MNEHVSTLNVFLCIERIFVCKGIGLVLKQFLNFIWIGIHPLEYGLTTHSSSMIPSSDYYAPELFNNIKMIPRDLLQTMCTHLTPLNCTLKNG